jgi:hypothetical protein
MSVKRWKNEGGSMPGGEQLKSTLPPPCDDDV